MLIIERFSKVLARIEARDYRLFDAKMPDGTLAFPNMHVENNESKVIIIYGDNASGKSLIATLFEYNLRKLEPKIPTRNACMANRTESGFQKAFIYGDESSQSTGQTSIMVAMKAFNATLEDTSGVVILDEPDVGLSDRFQAPLGQLIAQKALGFGDHGLILISHSKLLIDSFMAHYSLRGRKHISFVGVATEYDYPNWRIRQRTATIEELLALDDYASKKRVAISKTDEE